MELNDAFRRIVGVHWRIIVACVALGIAIGIAREVSAPAHYTASARLTLDAQDPRSASESTSLADTGKALATSRTVVAAALREAHAGQRDPATVARHVSVRAIGASGVLELSVTDRDANVVARIANALVRTVIRTRVGGSNDNYRRALEAISSRIEQMGATVTALDRKIATAEDQARGAAATGASTPRLGDLARAQGIAAQQLAALEASRNELLTQNALRPAASVVSSAIRPTAADPRNLVLNLILAGFGALIFVVGLAGLIETFGPTVVGGDAIARVLQTAHLGTIPHRPDRAQPAEDLEAVAGRLRLVTAGLARRQVALLTGDDGVEPAVLVRQLNAAVSVPVAETQYVAAGGRSATHAVASARDVSKISVYSLGASTRGANGARPGALVFVLPTAVKRSRLDELAALAQAADVPIAGVITYRGTILPGGAARSASLDGRRGEGAAA